MPNAIFRPWVPVRRFRSSSDGLQPQPDVSTLNHYILQLVGQQWWPVHYSTDPDFQHRSSRRCHIQQDDRSAASPSLLVVVLCVLPDIPSRVSSFHTDRARTLCSRLLQEIATGSILYSCSLPLGLHMFFLSSASSQISSHGTVISIATNVFDC